MYIEQSSKLLALKLCLNPSTMHIKFEQKCFAKINLGYREEWWFYYSVIVLLSFTTLGLLCYCFCKNEQIN